MQSTVFRAARQATCVAVIFAEGGCTTGGSSTGNLTVAGAIRSGKVFDVSWQRGMTEGDIAENERNRNMSWLGRPLAAAFYVFGMDERGRELFLDLDFPEPPVLVADYERRQGAVQAMTFREWISKRRKDVV